MANGLSTIVNAVQDTAARKSLLALGLQLDKVDRTLSTLRRNNEAVTDYALSSVSIIAGSGLTGGGDLTTSRTLNVGAGTGITVAADSVSISSSYLGANPTATIGLSVVNGSATTYMRSDAAPALSQGIAPTWSAVHTFSLQDVHTLGINLSTSGEIQSDVTDGANNIAFYFEDSVAASRTVRQDLMRYGASSGDHWMRLTNAGELSVGYGTSGSPNAPVAQTFLSFLGLTSRRPSWTSTVQCQGVMAQISHDDSSATAPATVTGVRGVAIHAQNSATKVPSQAMAFNGIYGMVGGQHDAASYSTKYMACFRGSFTRSGSLSSNDGQIDIQTHDRTPAGDWAHSTVYWSDMQAYHSLKGAIATLPTNKPAIASSARLVIMGMGTADQCAIFGESPALSTAGSNAATRAYFAKVPFPSNGSATNRSHLWFVPHTAEPTWAADGGAYFHDGTTHAEGLYEYYGSAWHHLMSEHGQNTDVSSTAITTGGIGAAGPAAAAQAGWVKVRIDDATANGKDVWLPYWV